MLIIKYGSLRRLSIACLTAFGTMYGIQGLAQDSATGDANEALEEVTVTGSRLRTRDGMETPTPVTAIEATELNILAPGNLIDAVQQMPQFLNNDTPTTAGSVVGALGASGVNLRGIGSNRTLVLLDGRRVPSFSRLGTPDISTFPEAMIRGIEVVTGGASAAYGSDAVSGTVNFLLDTDYTGLKGHVQGGITSRGDNENFEFSLSGGHALGERSHFIASIDYFEADKVESYEDRDWFQNWGTVDINGAANPKIVAADVHSRRYTAGGLIRLNGSALNGIHFLEGGVPATFQDGSIVGTTTQVGGTGFWGEYGSRQEDGSGLGGIYPDSERGSAFLYVDYDFTPDWTGFAQFMYGKNEIEFHDNGAHQEAPSYTATIYNNNAFLPPSILQIMTNEGRTSFPLSRFSSSADLGLARRNQDNESQAYTLGFEGNINDLHVNGYYQYGRSENIYTAIDYPRTDRLYRAMDAVVNPATGAIVCRSTLTLPNDGCVPANFFGPGTMSQEAVDYITEGDMYRASLVHQHFAELTVDTDIHEGWGAGPISLAAGASYREDSFSQWAGPADLVELDTPTAASQGYRGLPASFVGDQILQFGLGMGDDPIGGGFNVWEMFGETLIPVVRDRPFIQAIDVSGALRYAEYSVSGGVLAWKGGLDWRVNDDVRFRFTRSRDTRAATLRERFDQQGGGATINPDPVTGTIYSISQISGGNPAVDPEEGNTWTVGLVLTPTMLEGFALSADWFDVQITDYIAQIGIQRIVDDCFAGAVELCQRVIRDSGTNLITRVENVFLNVAEARVMGVDIEASYHTPINLFGNAEEDLSIRVFANYLQENSFTNVGVPKRDDAGTLNLPEWTITAMGSYRYGPFLASLTGRYLDGRLNLTTGNPTPAQTLNDMTVDSVFYTNLRMSYDFDAGKFGSHTLFLNVANLFDVDPPVVASWNDFFGAQSNTPGLHDELGRRFVVGVEFEF
jgi:outer membrane receptor protein involved in Fe transport